MSVRLRFAAVLIVFCSVLKVAGNDKKPALPSYVLRAESVFVLIDPDAGTSPASPQANQKARDDVEKAIMKWGRFRLAISPGVADLIIVVRKGSGRIVEPTIGGLPTNDRPVIVQPTDSGVRLGGQTPSRPSTQPGPQLEAGVPDDMFVVYQGGAGNPLDGPPVWRYMNKDALKSPNVPAVAEFRKAIEEAEKQELQRQQQQQQKQKQKQKQKNNP